MGRKDERRHRWGLNLWVTDAEEAKIRTHFARRIESLAEAVRRLLLAEIDGESMDKDKPITREILEDLRDYQNVKHLLNGDTVQLREGPVATRLLEFFQQRESWSTFNQGRPKL